MQEVAAAWKAVARQRQAVSRRPEQPVAWPILLTRQVLKESRQTVSSMFSALRRLFQTHKAHAGGVDWATTKGTRAKSAAYLGNIFREKRSVCWWDVVSLKKLGSLTDGESEGDGSLRWERKQETQTRTAIYMGPCALLELLTLSPAFPDQEGWGSIPASSVPGEKVTQDDSTSATKRALRIHLLPQASLDCQ